MSRLLTLTLAALVLFACSKGNEPAAPAAQPAPQASAAAPAPAPTAAPAPTQAPAAAAPPAASLGSATYSADPNVRADLLEVKRVSGGALVAKWRVMNAGTANVYYNFDWNDIYYVDPAENKKYEYLKDSEGNRILDVYWGTLKPGEQRTNWAKFPAPPPTSTKISLTLPKFAPFEDVPVAQ
jgi:hypothetical protein